MSVEMTTLPNGILSLAGDTVRVDVAHVRKKAIANDAVLDDKVTASHYQYGALDSYNKEIVEGQEFDYIDWYSDERVHGVYKKDKTGRFVQVGDYYTERDQAVAAAVALAS